MEQRAIDALRMGDTAFSKKESIDSLWQEIALNFYPERADFTTERSVGDEFADHLYSSYPVLARRELGNMVAASLRPRSTKWFSIHVDQQEVDESDEERAFLEYITDIQWRAMYDAESGFIRATKQADHDFVAFGNAVIYFGMNENGDGLMFRNYHLRDTVWSENAAGKIDCIHRNWKPTARQLVATFGEDKVSKSVKQAMEKEPEKEISCRHIILPSRIYNYTSKRGKKFPYVSLFVERDAQHLLEETGISYCPYVIPRWHTVAGSVFGSSMATSIILPDGRTMQVMTRTIREAGEKYVRPPMLAFSDAVRGDIALYAGGVTTAEVEYLEHGAEVLQPLQQQKDGMPIGMELSAALREDIRQGFFLDKIRMPDEVAGDGMTAYEVRKRIEDSLRAQSPIFEPIEQDYSDPLCSGVFDLLMENGAFPVQMMPESLSGADVNFSFRSPLAEMAEAAEAQAYQDVVAGILAPLMEIDPAQLEQADLTRATRDAMRAKGWKQKWFKPLEAVQARQEEMAKAAEMQQGAEAIGGAAAIAEQGGNAAVALKEAGVEI